MTFDCWSLPADQGFLIHPDPLVSLLAPQAQPLPLPHATVEPIEATASSLPTLLRNPESARRMLEDLPTLPINAETPFSAHQWERVMQVYSFFANAFVYADPAAPVKWIPSSISTPLLIAAGYLGRPPILSYAGFVLLNWRLRDPQGGLVAENLDPLMTFTDTPDEKWFALIHVEVEARAAEALNGAFLAQAAVVRDDGQGVFDGLQAIARGLRAMIKTFRKMRSGCDPDIYYDQVRPYQLGFINVVYAGGFGDAPQNFRGGSGAQSSVIPALVAAMGIQHTATDLLVHLDAMQPYMPAPHRALITDLRQNNVIRPFVLQQRDTRLNDAYNDALTAITQFRRLHMNYANLYVLQRGGGVGTGGTPFMDWLDKLIAETEAHAIL